MENRDKKLTDIRPALELAKTGKEIEQFQNETLRPILKFQHHLIQKICYHQFVKRKKVFFKLEASGQAEYIEQLIIKDKSFKNILFGIIIGHFTLTEYDFFKIHESELKKRITTLLIQRIQSLAPAIIAQS